MSIKSRAETSDLVLSLGEKVVQWVPQAVGVLGFGTLSAVLAKLTKPLEGYAPFSWLACGAAGAVLFLLGYWLWCGARLKVGHLRFVDRITNTRDYVNPVEQTFTDRRIDLSAFSTPIPRPLRNKTFVNCELFGPGVIYLGGRVSLGHVEFSHCDFVLVKTGARMLNVIPFFDMTMRGGVLHNATIYVTPDSYDGLPENINWLTPSLPHKVV